MLKDIKQTYEHLASGIANYKSINKNTLLRAYVDVLEQGDLENAEMYFGAIVCRYWGLIDKYYNLNMKVVSKEMCYDWLINALLYALSHHRWTDPDASVYNDPNGPDKIVNRCMLCEKQSFYQNSNYDKNAINYRASSLDKMVEDAGDSVFSETDITTLDDVVDSTVDLVKKEFLMQNYFTAIMIDGIVNFDTFVATIDDNGKHMQFSKRKLIKHIKTLDDDFINYFSKKYSVPKERVSRAVYLCQQLTPQRAYTQLRVNLDRLKTYKFLTEKL